MESGDTHRGQGGAFHIGGDQFQSLEGLDLSVSPATFHSGGSLSNNSLVPLRYRAWQQVECQRIRALSAK